MKTKCICEICTCGRHRCPHNRGSIGTEPIRAGCLLSEYQKSYEKFVPQSPRQSKKPPRSKHTMDGPMEKGTIYSQAYVKHGIHKRDLIKGKPEYELETGSMDVPTTYKQDFDGKSGKRPKSYAPDHTKNKDPSDKPTLSTKTMYRVSYPDHGPEDWAWCRATPAKHHESIKTDNGGKFNNTSTMKEDFKIHESPERARPIKPNQETLNTNDEFDGNTTYKQQFVPKAPEPVAAIKKKEYVPNTTPFLTKSTMRAAYQGITDPAPEKSFKPHQEYKPCPTAFQGDTTSSRAYKSWPVSKPRTPVWAKKQQYKEPSLAFDTFSSYQADFVERVPSERPAAAKPQNPQLSLAQERVCVPVRTQYQSEYVTYCGDIEPQASFKKIATYETPKEAMLGVSVYQSCYTGDSTERSKPCIPVSQSASEAEKPALDCSTVYQQTYRGSKTDRCMAADIVLAAGQRQAKSRNEKLKEAGHSNGHHYFNIVQECGDSFGKTASKTEMKNSPSTQTKKTVKIVV